MIWIIPLRIFYVFEGLWWKFFGALESWIHRASLIYGLLRFLEAFELDSSDLWDLGRQFRWFCFECSLHLRSKFLKFLEASGLNSNRVSVLLNLLWCCLCSRWLDPFSQDVFVYWNTLGRLLFIGVWGWVSDMWQSLIGDTCHSLIGPLMSSITCARLLMSSLTRAGLLMSSLTRADVWLVFCMHFMRLFQWHLAKFYWFLSSDSKT